MFSIKFSTGVFSVILLSTALFITTTAVAQTPTTPRPSPTPRHATRPPGQEVPTLPPGAQPQTTNPTAPPGTQRTSPVTPPATNPATPTQTPTSAPTSTPAVTADQEPREPVIPSFQAQPMPPLPDMSRLGVTNTTLPLSLNDAIKRALENNNDIEIAKDDVRIAETQLRAL